MSAGVASAIFVVVSYASAILLWWAAGHFGRRLNPTGEGESLVSKEGLRAAISYTTIAIGVSGAVIAAALGSPAWVIGIVIAAPALGFIAAFFGGTGVWFLRYQRYKRADPAR